MRPQSFRDQLTNYINEEYQRLVSFTGKLASFDDQHSAEDLFQDVMLNLFEKADIKTPVENLSAYVYRSIRNRVIDFFRKRKPKQVSLDQPIGDSERLTLADIIAGTKKDEATGERDEIAKKLFSILNTLSKEDRSLVIATELDNQSFVDLAKQSGVSENTLRSQKFRALKKIKRQLNNSSRKIEDI